MLYVCTITDSGEEGTGNQSLERLFRDSNEDHSERLQAHGKVSDATPPLLRNSLEVSLDAVQITKDT